MGFEYIYNDVIVLYIVFEFIKFSYYVILYGVG